MIHKIQAMIDAKQEPFLPTEERQTLKRMLTAKNTEGQFCFGNMQVSRFLKDCYPEASPSEAAVRRWRKDCLV